MSQRTVIGEAIITAQQPNGLFTPLAATAPTQASGVLTSNNTNVSNGDTVTIGSTVYTFVTALAVTFTAGQVLIGSSADNSLTHLAAAINGTGGGVYWALKPNPQVTSSAVASHALTITAQSTDASGAALGNSITTTTTAATLYWASATLTGGAAGSLDVSVNVSSIAPLAAPNRITGQFTSTGTATKIVSAQITGVGCTISNGSTNPLSIIYIGPSGVTTGNGAPIFPGQTVQTTNRVDTYVIDDGTNHATGGTISEYN